MDLTFEITYRCNFNCMHCLVPDDVRIGADKKKELTTYEIKQLIDEMSKIKVFRFSISGGEPLLREDLSEILLYAANHDLWVTFVTNSYFITKKFIDKINRADIAEIHLSLDGAYEQTHDKFRGKKGAYNRVLKAVNLIKKNTSIPIIITSVASKYNYNEIKKIYELSKEKLKVDGFRVDFFTPSGHGLKFFKQLMLSPDEYMYIYSWLYNLEKYEKEMNSNFKIYRYKFYDFLYNKNLTSTQNIKFIDLLDYFKERGKPACEAGITRCAMTPYGDIIPCTYFNEPKFYGGNIRNNTLKEIWNNSEILKQFRNIDDFGETCKKCINKSYCFGGCRGAAYNFSNNITAPDPYCPIHWTKFNK